MGQGKLGRGACAPQEFALSHSQGCFGKEIPSALGWQLPGEPHTSQGRNSWRITQRSSSGKGLCLQLWCGNLQRSSRARGKRIVPQGPKGGTESQPADQVFSEQPGMEEETEILPKAQASFLISIANNQWTHSEEFYH